MAPFYTSTLSSKFWIDFLNVYTKEKHYLSTSCTHGSSYVVWRVSPPQVKIHNRLMNSRQYYIENITNCSAFGIRGCLGEERWSFVSLLWPGGSNSKWILLLDYKAFVMYIVLKFTLLISHVHSCLYLFHVKEEHDKNGHVLHACAIMPRVA